MKILHFHPEPVEADSIPLAVCLRTIAVWVAGFVGAAFVVFVCGFVVGYL